MSWLTGLAGKAEHLLNNLDHAAGQALITEDEIDSGNWPASTVAMHTNVNESYSPYLSQKSDTHLKPASVSNAMSSSSSVPSNLSQLNSENAYMSQMSHSMYAAPPPSQNSLGKQTPTRTGKKDTDEDLFAFLNSSNGEGVRKKQVTKIVTNGKHSRQSSTSSTHSARSGKVLETVQNANSTDMMLTMAATDGSGIYCLYQLINT